MERKEIMKNISTAMVNSGITNKHFETKLGVSKSHIRYIKAEKTCPSLWVAKGMADILGICLDELVGIKPKRLCWEERTGGIGEHMRRVRLEQDVSLADLEAWSGVSAECISYLERDKHDPCLFTIITLAEALWISPAEYIGDTPPTKRGGCRRCR